MVCAATSRPVQHCVGRDSSSKQGVDRRKRSRYGRRRVRPPCGGWAVRRCAVNETLPTTFVRGDRLVVTSCRSIRMISVEVQLY